MVRAQVPLDNLCGKHFRIMTHASPPFINVDTGLCINQRCPPEAFGRDGGLSYRFIMEDVQPQLVRMCSDAGLPPTVELSWYVAASDKTSAQGAINTVCNGDFAANQIPLLINGTYCPSGYNNASAANDKLYLGPSPAGTCTFVNDPSCVSPGPDMVIGAVHVTVERLSQLQFSAPYMNVQQTIVKRPEEGKSIADSFLNIFLAFDGLLWLAIIIECILAWLMLLLVESSVNEDIMPGLNALYDTWYWVFSTLLGGADKAPVTVGGKIIFCAHTFFSVVIIATYTGGVAAFLTQQASVPVVTGFSSLSSGAFSVVVRGPSWDSLAIPPDYLGDFAGGNSNPDVTPSLQFKYLQVVMRASQSASFTIFTTQRLESRRRDDTALTTDRDTNPCNIDGATLGAYDLVKCGSDGPEHPDTMIFDTPAVIYELNLRKNRTGVCGLVTVGKEFNPTGFGIGFPFNSNLHLAWSEAMLNQIGVGKIDSYIDEYQISQNDNQCKWQEPDGGLAMTIKEMSGLFTLTALGLLAACLHSLYERRLYRKAHMTDDEALIEIEKRALAKGKEDDGEDGVESDDEAEEAKKEEKKKKEEEEKKKEEDAKKKVVMGSQDNNPVAIPEAEGAGEDEEAEEMLERLEEMEDQMSRIETLASKVAAWKATDEQKKGFQNTVNGSPTKPAAAATQREASGVEEPAKEHKSFFESIKFW